MGTNHWKKIGLSLAIIVVMNLFVNIGIETFYDGPTYQDYCGSESLGRPEPQLNSKAACEEAGGKWKRNWCDLYGDCQAAYSAENSVYSRNVFILLVIVGTIALVLGIFLRNVNAVANGLTFGGILSLFIGTVRYWSDMDEYIRFIILGIVLALLIILGVVKLRDSHATPGVPPEQS